MNNQEHKKLILEIRRAFKNVAFPGDKSNKVGNWWEISRLLGKKWQDVSVEDVNINSGLHFLTAKGLRYYLPAYLIAILTNPEQVNGNVRESVLDVLSPSETTNNKRLETLIATNFSSAQKQVIYEFLKVFDQLYPLWVQDWDIQEILKRGLEYWGKILST